MKKPGRNGARALRGGVRKTDFKYGTQEIRKKYATMELGAQSGNPTPCKSNFFYRIAIHPFLIF
jgi:hypothetical protein